MAAGIKATRIRAGLVAIEGRAAMAAKNTATMSSVAESPSHRASRCSRKSSGVGQRTDQQDERTDDQDRFRHAHAHADNVSLELADWPKRWM